ncbi:MAG: BamA/TamA family outer membrane protein [Flavisolibacter sp.]
MHTKSQIRIPAITTIILCMIVIQVNGQDAVDSTLNKDCQTKDVTDYLRQWFHMKPKTTQKESSFFIAPVVGSTPSTGVVVGIALQSAFKLPSASLSAFQANVQYTMKKQFSVSLENNVFARENKIFLSGDWSYYDYSQPTYGLGTNAPNRKLGSYFAFNNVGEPKDSQVQPMRFKYYKLHQTFSFKVKQHFYIGPGIHYDQYAKIEDLNLDTASHHITSHYAYSQKHGFDPTHYTVMGMSLNMVFDNRDNSINAYKGMYANLNYRVNPKFLGSDESSSVLWAEFRTYHGVSKKQPSEVLAFWVAGEFTMSGTLPYLNLPAIGNDQRQKTGRGYTIARFRGNQMVYGEMEFRYPISKCTHTLGAVVFINGVTTSSEDTGVKLFDYIRPGFGIGLRFLFQKQSRMNIQADYAKGNDSGGIYFGASEVF